MWFLICSCDLIYDLWNWHWYPIKLVSSEKSLAEECDSLLENAAKTAMKLAAEPRCKYHGRSLNGLETRESSNNNNNNNNNNNTFDNFIPLFDLVGLSSLS